MGLEVAVPDLAKAVPDQPTLRPYPEIARAIRTQTEHILDEWRGHTLFAMPDLATLTREEFIDHIAEMLAALADALESNNPRDLHRLLRTAPSHGYQRFLKEFDLAEVFAEERILRRVIVARVEQELGRQCTPEEAASLHAMLDIMFQHAILGLVDQQRQQLRSGAEAELTFLSFLSHDLGNNLFVITSYLEFIKNRLDALPEMKESAEKLDSALKVITRTTQGMRTLLAHARLRRGGAPDKPVIGPVRLRETVDAIVKVIEDDAVTGDCALDVAIDPEATVSADASLLTIVLQNLIGNAVKHTCRDGGGLVSIRARRTPAPPGRLDPQQTVFWEIAVTDNGPGIPEDRLRALFDPFKLPSPPAPSAPLQRASENGAPGFGFGSSGLGLVIAGQAAMMLGTRIEVKTKRDEGSTFSFLMPAR